MISFAKDVELFVCIGGDLRKELEKDDSFRHYFENKNNISFFDKYEDIDHQIYPKDTTVFIVRTFHYYEPPDADEDDNNNDDDNLAQEDNQIFIDLLRRNCSVMGYVALLQQIGQLRSTDDPIKMVPSNRPLHSLAMQNTILTFSGITSKLEAQRLLTLTRYMGAKSREDVSNRTTHLVAGNLRGIKYRRALELGLSLMSKSWVEESFVMSQDDPDFDATKPDIIQRYRLKPFHGLHMAFVGFNETDAEELNQLTTNNDGFLVNKDDPNCTHIVIDIISGDDDNFDLLNDFTPNANAYVVYKEWFWASLEMEGKASEDSYLVPGFKIQTRRASKSRQSLIGQYILSPTNNLLDYSRSPDSMISRTHLPPVVKKEKLELTNITARHRACLELLQTERNYVKILETIVNLFKLPLENPDNPMDPILPMTDIKIIFGNLTNIYEVHKRMLSNLEVLIEQAWSETNCIGKIFVSHSVDLLKAYPPFVNFFEDTKKTIIACDQKYPRFHAFLKRCQSNKECNRESLTEMLIRPVQRLPSISMLLTELIKRTDDTNLDKKYLIEALESIRRVMNLINEDKRKTEGQIAMFDIVNNIEDCPPNLLSALRSFVCKVEARILFLNSESEVVPSRSHKIVLFLFSDLIEICKIRSIKKAHSFRTQRTPLPIRRATNNGQPAKMSTKKENRHLDQLHLCDVMNIYRNCQSKEMQDAIVIQARPSPRYDQNFRYYPIVIEDEFMCKDAFLEKLNELIQEFVPDDSKAIANDEIDFGYAKLLVNTMEKGRLTRVFSIRQALRSPSIKNI